MHRLCPAGQSRQAAKLSRRRKGVFRFKPSGLTIAKPHRYQFSVIAQKRFALGFFVGQGTGNVLPMLQQLVVHDQAIGQLLGHGMCQQLLQLVHDDMGQFRTMIAADETRHHQTGCGV